MVSELVLAKRLHKLREYVRLLNILRSEPKERFISEPFVYGNAERYLQLAIQTALDIGNHILADRKFKEPDEYRDVIRMLGEHGVIEKDLAARLLPLVGLRNILVHEYMDIDRGRLYESIQNELEDFELFARQVGKLL